MNLHYCSIFILPSHILLLVEVTYPANESTSAGVLIIIGNLESILFIVAYSVWEENAIAVTLILILIYAGTIQVIIPWRPVYKRLEFEEEDKLNH